MRHLKSGVKLNRDSAHRKAMFRNMVTSLFKYDKIKTTDAKAKELRSWADHIVTLAKRGDLHARRQALSIMRDKDVVHKLFDEASARFENIRGGYTRITKLGIRAGDAAKMSIVEVRGASSVAKPTEKKKGEEKSQPETVKEKSSVEAKQKPAVSAETNTEEKDK